MDKEKFVQGVLEIYTTLQGALDEVELRARLSKGKRVVPGVPLMAQAVKENVPQRKLDRIVRKFKELLVSAKQNPSLIKQLNKEEAEMWDAVGGMLYSWAR